MNDMDHGHHGPKKGRLSKKLAIPKFPKPHVCFICLYHLVSSTHLDLFKHVFRPRISAQARSCRPSPSFRRRISEWVVRVKPNSLVFPSCDPSNPVRVWASHSTDSSTALSATKTRRVWNTKMERFSGPRRVFYTSEPLLIMALCLSLQIMISIEQCSKSPIISNILGSIIPN